MKSVQIDLVLPDVEESFYDPVCGHSVRHVLASVCINPAAKHGCFLCITVYAGCRNLIPLWLSISGMRPGSDNPSAEAPWGVGGRL